MRKHWVKFATGIALTAFLGCGDATSGPTGLETSGLDPDPPIVQGSHSPIVTGFSPNPAHPGQLVTISGSRFGSDPYRVNVTFNGIIAEVQAVSDNSMQVVVPPQLQAGEATVSVHVVMCGAVTTRMMIEAAASGPPAGNPPGGGGQPGDGGGGDGGGDGGDLLGIDIVLITPNPAFPGQRIAIEGNGFGDDSGALTLTFDGIQGNVEAVVDTRIDADVPVGLEPGTRVTVAATVNGQSDSASLDIIAPPGGGGDDDGGDGDDGEGDQTSCGNRVLSADLENRTVQFADGRNINVQSDGVIDAGGDLATMTDLASALGANADVTACVTTEADLEGNETVTSTRFDLENAHQVSGEVASVDPLTGTIVLDSGTRVQPLANADISGDYGSLSDILTALLQGEEAEVQAEGFLEDGDLRATSLVTGQL